VPVKAVASLAPLAARTLRTSSAAGQGLMSWLARTAAPAHHP
jgi:hypothetical protein